MSSFFPWMGGKTRIAKRIVAVMPDHSCYVEVFAGAANVLFNKPKVKVEILNDINNDLVNLFRVAKYHRRELMKQLSLNLCSRSHFEHCRSGGLTDIQRAANTWFILKTAFGGRGGSPRPTFGYSTTGKGSFSRSALSVIRDCHKRLDGVYIECLDFADCIKRYDRAHSLFYCDPPYLQTAGYRDVFTIEHHRKLADQLSKIKGKFLLSINDHPDIRKLYKDFQIRQIAVQYSVARVKTPSSRNRTELLIANYPLPKTERI